MFIHLLSLSIREGVGLLAIAHTSHSLLFTLKHGVSWSTSLQVKLWHAGYHTQEEAKDLVAIDSWGFMREIFAGATHDVPRRADFPLVVCERTRWREVLNEAVDPDHILATLPAGPSGLRSAKLIYGPWDTDPGVLGYDVHRLNLRPQSPAQANAIYAYRIRGSRWHRIRALGSELHPSAQTSLQRWL